MDTGFWRLYGGIKAVYYPGRSGWGMRSPGASSAAESVSPENAAARIVLAAEHNTFIWADCLG